jgi:hypothetical protein
MHGALAPSVHNPQWHPTPAMQAGDGWWKHVEGGGSARSGVCDVCVCVCVDAAPNCERAPPPLTHLIGPRPRTHT